MKELNSDKLKQLRGGDGLAEYCCVQRFADTRELVACDSLGDPTLLCPPNGGGYTYQRILCSACPTE